ncbi:TPA: hypothetical protein MNE63_003476 [Citrobacter farmeri]|nr:hypothetical protein [Citrobacter farmeri]HBZ8835169.1 hypothetical protein [Citrobacter farmeri]HBZ9640328.1 hypothetical protein [Citrobacter farmeri]HCA0088250.1 hypothetical protein [Citrobacter farmeri]HCA1885485.1 hypothetical protein [Citrobacter farmeri]
MMMFVRHAKQVALIIKVNCPLRLNQKKAIHRPLIAGDGCTPGHQRIGLLRFIVQPGDKLLFCKRLPGGFHRKTGSEHLR